MSRLENINKVKDMWGGYLIWDSINKTLQLRDEEKWQNDTGFQIRYRKNLKTISRLADYNIVTRLYPFGLEDLNIASVNGGVLYIDDFSYCSDVLVGTYSNPNIADAAQLLTAAQKVLAKGAKPRFTYTCKAIHLESLDGYEHETYDIGDIVTVYDENLGINHKQRIYKEKADLIKTWDRDLTIGDKGYSLEREIMEALKVKERVNEVITDTGTINIMPDTLPWSVLYTYEAMIAGVPVPYIDENGVNPQAIEDINKITNSDFEVYDPVTMIPYYWEGCVSDPDSCWRGTYAARITGVMKQKEIDASGMADPAWWDSELTVVAFRQRIGAVTVSVHSKTTGAALNLNNPDYVEGGTAPATVTSITYPTPASWRDGFRFFRYQPPAGVGKVYLQFEGVGTYIDCVQTHGLMNALAYPCVYYPGPKSFLYEPVERTEWKVIPWATSTEITLVNLYTNMPCVTCTPMSDNESDFGNTNDFTIVAIPVTEMQGGVSYYSKVKINVVGPSIPTPAAGYIAVSAVCRGMVGRVAP
jgi:hypothetical protein